MEVPNQLNLFSNVTPELAPRAETLVMSADALLKWKSQIFEYQQKVRENKPPEQVTLFDNRLSRVVIAKG